MNERLTKTSRGNWLGLSFFSFGEDPRPLWGRTALLAGTLDREGGGSLSHFAPNLQEGFKCKQHF